MGFYKKIDKIYLCFCVLWAPNRQEGVGTGNGTDRGSKLTFNDVTSIYS